MDEKLSNAPIKVEFETATLEVEDYARLIFGETEKEVKTKEKVTKESIYRTMPNDLARQDLIKNLTLKAENRPLNNDRKSSFSPIGIQKKHEKNVVNDGISKE